MTELSSRWRSPFSQWHILANTNNVQWVYQNPLLIADHFKSVNVFLFNHPFFLMGALGLCLTRRPMIFALNQVSDHLEGQNSLEPFGLSLNWVIQCRPLVPDAAKEPRGLVESSTCFTVQAGFTLHAEAQKHKGYWLATLWIDVEVHAGCEALQSSAPRSDRFGDCSFLL